MKKKSALLLYIIIFLSAPLPGDTAEDGETRFSFTDLFQYNRPVEKSEDEKKLFLNFTGGYTGKKGNTESTTKTYGCSAKFDDNHTVLKVTYSGSYGEYNGLVIENKGTATANFDYFLFWRIEFFSYTMSDYDKITLLTHRNGTGAGAKIYIIKNQYILLDFSGAPILQYEKYEEQPAEKDWRYSFRGRIELFPSDEDFTIRYYAYYIPAMENTNEYRTVQDVYILKKLAGALGIRAGYRREYNTYNDEAFEKNPLLKKLDSTTYIQVSLSL